MKRTILAVFALVLSLASFAQKLPADQIIGIWICEEYKIEVFKAGNTYAAKLFQCPSPYRIHPLFQAQKNTSQ